MQSSYSLWYTDVLCAALKQNSNTLPETNSPIRPIKNLQEKRTSGTKEIHKVPMKTEFRWRFVNFFFFVWISFCNFLLTLLLSVFLVSLISTVWSSFQARAFSANFSPFDCTHIQINLNYCYFFLFKKGYAWPVWTKFEPAAHRLLILLTVCI